MLIYGQAELAQDDAIGKRIAILARHLPEVIAQEVAQDLASQFALLAIRIKPRRVISYDDAKRGETSRSRGTRDERRKPMSEPQPKLSNAFQVFLSEAPQHAQAWMAAVQGLDSASALDKKTEELAYLAVLAALRMESGIPFHVQSAKQAGASREQVISAILVGLPAAGQMVTQALPAAITAYDAQ